MFAYFLLGCGILIGLVLLASWFAWADPKAIVKGLRWVGVIAGLVLIILILAGGARIFGWMLVPLLLLLFMRQGVVRGLLNRIKAAGGGTPGQVSTVTTRYLRMTLDHDTGAMEGRVVAGAYQGRELRDLTREELLGLWRECCSEDEDSARVLEAYLDRTYGPEWRTAAGAGGDAQGDETARAGGAMTRAEALEMLGLADGCTPEDVKAAHRRLMRKVHPDAGGSTYLATKINEAKALLLGE